MDLESRVVMSSTATPASNIGVNLNSNTAAGDPMWVDVHNVFRTWGPFNNFWATSPAPPVNSDNYPLAPASTWANLGSYPDGAYQLSYQGTATLTFSGIGQLVGSITTSNGVSTGTVQVNHALGTGLLILTVAGVSSTSTFSNFHLYLPGYGTNPTQVFTNQFLQQVQPFSTVRFMNWNQTNNSTQTNWSDRTPPTSFITTGSTGVPYEDMIALANEAQTNMWINIPALATPTYVQDLAQLIQANLDPNLKVYVEYSNETWNGGFSAYSQILAAAQSNPLVTATSNFDKVAEQSAYMEIQDGGIFKTVFGSSSAQVIPVLAGWAYGSSYQQAALQWVQSTYGSPANYFGDLAIAPYIGLPSGVDVKGLTLNQLFAGLNQTLNTSYVSQLQTNASIASTYGLSLVAYEGGQSMTAQSGLNYAVKEQAKNDPRMFQLYVAMIQDWNTYVGSKNVFMDYYLSGGDSVYGFWGLLPSVASTGSQEYDALISMIYPAGDADMDGVVGPNDFQTVQQNMGLTGAWWEQGVFNDSGVVNWASVNAVKTNFNPQDASLAQFAQMAVFGEPSVSLLGQTQEFDAYGVTYLSDLPWVSSYSGQGSVQRDQSSSGHALQLGSATYAKGLGFVTNSQVVVNLNGQYSQFQSDIGLNQGSPSGSIVFQVYGDGTLLYSSPTLTSWSAVQQIDVNVAGVQQLTLDVVRAGSTTVNASADWADARLISTANFGSTTPYSMTYSVSLNGTVLTTQTTDSFIFKSLQDGLYTITGTATDSSGSSASASATIEVGLHAPWIFNAVPGNGQVQLEWTAIGGVVSQDIYRGTSPSSLALLVSDVAGTSYTDLTVSNGTTYYYAIAGVDSAGNPGPPDPTLQVMPTVVVSGDTYLNNMSFLSSSNGTGAVQRNTSDISPSGVSWYMPIHLGWQVAPQGLGVQANSVVVVATNGAYESFKAKIGLDSFAGSGGSVVFSIRDGLGNTLYTSPVMTPSSAPILINIPVANTQELMFSTTATGTSNAADYADWGYARLVPVGLTYASTLPFAKTVDYQGPVIRDGSNESPTYPNGGPMIMAGNQYIRGIGTSAFSLVSIDLNGAYSTFDATIGFDQVAGPNALPVAFQVFLDGKGIYWSGFFGPGTAPQAISLNVKGGNVLTLQVDSGAQYGFEFYNQYVDWALAELWK